MCWMLSNPFAGSMRGAPRKDVADVGPAAADAAAVVTTATAITPRQRIAADRSNRPANHATGTAPRHRYHGGRRPVVVGRRRREVSESDGDRRIPVTLIPGDGIGPECVDAARRVVEATGAPIDWEINEAGAEV